MWAALNNEPGQSDIALNWTFLADKFPGVRDADMDLLFQVLLLSPPLLGRNVWGGYEEGDAQPSDLLADNLAGALNALAPHPHRLSTIAALPASGSSFGWELVGESVT